MKRVLTPKKPAKPGLTSASRVQTVDRRAILRLGLMVGLLLVMTLSVAGCARLGVGQGVTRQTQQFDGQTFRGTAKAERDDPQRFVASVRDPAKSIDGAVQAAEYQGIRHCIEVYGTSEIDWEVGPDTPKDQLQIGDTLTLSGRCKDF